MIKKKKREFMSKEELIEDFNERYSGKPKWLEDIAQKNKYYVNKFILGKPKNPFYKEGYNSIKRGDKEYYALIDWIIPKRKYEYRYNVSKREYCFDQNVFRSSIIPVVTINDENYWILGSFHDYEDTNNPILTGFGGRCESKDKGECLALDCAIRELKEESKDLLTEEVLYKIGIQEYDIFKGTGKYKGEEENVYFMFVEIDYEYVKNIVEDFKNKIYILDNGKIENLGPIGFYKQRDVKSAKYRTSNNLTDLLNYMYKFNL